MTTANLLRLTETLGALGAAWLLTYAVHSTVLVAAAWVLQRLGAVRSLRLRDLAWKGALVGGLFTASLQMAMGLAPWGLTLEVPQPEVFAAALLKTASAQPHPAAEADTPRGSAVVVTRTEEGPDVTLTPTNTPSGASEADVTPAASAFPESPAAVAVPTVRVGSFFFMAWVAASSVLLLRLAVARARVLDGLGYRRPVLDASLRSQLDKLCAAAGRTSPVRLTTAEGLKSPVALGWSEICLPAAALEELDVAQQRSVLAHELAHLERKDPLWLLLGTTLEQLLFFQPLNRLARRNLQEVAEYLCDDWAAVADGSGLPIARGLAEVARWLDGEERAVPLAGMAERPSLLVARVQRLLGATVISLEPRRSWHLLALGLVLLLTVVFVPGVRAAPVVGWFEGEGHESARAEARAEAKAEASEAASAEAVAVATQSPEPAADVAQSRADVARARVAPLLLAQADPAPYAVAAVPPVPPVAPVPPVPPLPANVAWDMKQVKLNLQAHKMAMAQVKRQLAHAHLNVTLHNRHGRSGKGAPTTTADAATVDALVKALKDADAGVREAAAESLGRLGDTRAVDGLMAAASDSEVRVRAAAVEALAALEDVRAIPILAKALKDANVSVRRAAAEALASMDEAPQTVEPLVSALSDSDVHVRLAAVQGLAARKDKRALSALGGLAKDSSPEVRAAAVSALGELQDPAAIPALTAALKDDNEQVREMAVRGLGNLDSDKATPALIEATKDRSASVRAAAANALAEHHDASTSAAVVGALKALLEDSSPDVREEAISALSEIRDAGAVQALIAAMQSKDPVVRKAAAAALGQRD
jgi:Zn-dependent protease with chaperone function